jgi:hypothetical protein
MSDVYIHHHLGLGDMIHCNGMVRAILETRPIGDRIFVFCKNRHRRSTEWMYRDEPRIQVIGIDEKKDEVKQVDAVISARKDEDIEFLRIGLDFYGLTQRLNPDPKDPWTCDMIFYKQLNMPYEWRYSKCFWQRELDEEERVYRKMTPPGGDYVFVHDDPSRGLVISDANVGTSLPIVRNDISEMIFHMGLLLERAKEIHVMESSIRCMVEHLDTTGVKLVFYKWRGGPWYNEKKKKWRGTSKVWEIR